MERTEVRGEGLPDQVHHALEWAEFINVLLCIRTMFGAVAGVRRALISPLIAIPRVQWQLIACINDVMQLEKTCNSPCYAYDFALTAKRKKSKTNKKK